jgi:hypothetical protein
VTVRHPSTPIGDRVRLAEARRIVARETGRYLADPDFVELCDRLDFQYGRKQGHPHRGFGAIRPDLATATVTHEQIDEIARLVTGWNYDGPAAG